MPESHTPHGESEEKDRVRKELKDLRKLKAPWYFEARLKQRLTGKQLPAFSFKPVPSYVLSTVVVVLIGIAGYYTFINPGHADKEQSMEGKNVREAGQDEATPPPPPPPPRQNPQPQREATGEQQVSQQQRGGPSISNKEATIESQLDVTVDSGNGSAALPQKSIFPSSQSEQLPTQAVNLWVDTAQSRMKKEDSLLRVKTDSLNNLDKMK